MSHRISVVITTLDEYFETQKTIASIRDTAGDNPDICVVDDGSQLPLTLLDKGCTLIRNESRAGVGAARHIGALQAKGDILLITDSHVRFEPGWYEKTLAIASDRPHTLHCGSCVGLTESQMDMTKSNLVYNGAFMKFYGEDANRRGHMQVLEGCWLPDTPQDDFPMSSIMGAAYVMHTDWFFHIGGLRMLKQYGSDEVLLALKTWLAGGDVRMMKSLRIGHMFRDVAHYRSESWSGLYNKLMIAHTCLPPEFARRLIAKIPNSKELSEAKRRIDDDSNLILSERAYNEAIFKRSFEWFIEYFKLEFPA